jgi:hypothetical protein
MTDDKQYRASFEACVESLRDPLLDVSKDYDTDVIISALYEIGMRLSLLKYGTMGSFGLLADVLHTFTTAGPMIDEMEKNNNKTGDAMSSVFSSTKTDTSTKH